VGNAPAGLAGYDSHLLAQLAASEYVVQATVTQASGSTVIGPVDPGHTVIAHVDGIVFQDDQIQQLGDPWGSSITIDVKGAGLSVGEHVFLVSDLAEFNGGQLEVVELARIDTAAHPDAATVIPRIRALFASNPLYARVATSATIVSGTTGHPSPFNTQCGSEHCPDWQVSNVTVTDVLCGPDGATAQAGFASSNDIAWTNAPKLAAGQNDVLLLHSYLDPFSTWAPNPSEIVIDPLDVHPSTDLPMIEDLLANPPALP
jgi:hypothetical protein